MARYPPPICRVANPTYSVTTIKCSATMCSILPLYAGLCHIEAVNSAPDQQTSEFRRLPESIDTVDFFQDAVEQKVAYAPGVNFLSQQGRRAQHHAAQLFLRFPRPDRQRLKKRLGG